MIIAAIVTGVWAFFVLALLLFAYWEKKNSEYLDSLFSECELCEAPVDKPKKHRVCRDCRELLTELNNE